MFGDPAEIVSAFDYYNVLVAVPQAAAGILLLPADPYRVYMGMQFVTTGSIVIWPSGGDSTTGWNFTNATLFEFFMERHGGLCQSAWYARDTNVTGGTVRLIWERYQPGRLSP